MKKTAYVIALAAIASLLALPAPAQELSLYLDEVSFLAAAGPTEIVDFEGTVPPGEFVFLGDPGEFSNGDITITNNSPMFLQNNSLYGSGTYLSAQQAAPQFVNVVLPPNTVAASFNYQSESLSVTLLANSYAVEGVPVGELGFFGITSTVPFRILRLSTSGSSIDLDNIRFVVDPSAGIEPPVNDGDGMNNIPGGGELVATFGSGGILFVPDLPGLEGFILRSIGTQPDGKLVVAGRLAPDGAEPRLAVVRLDENGVLDSAFGSDGIAIVDVVTGGEEISGMEVLADGSIVFVGSTSTDSTDDDSYIAKLDADGDPVPGFGVNGLARTNLVLGQDDGGPVRGFDRIQAQADGKLLMGALWSYVYRYRSDGTLDTDFGFNGQANRFGLWGAFGLAVDIDGTIISGGGDFVNPEQDFLIVRHNSDGRVALEFGIEGVASIAPTSANDVIIDLVIDSKRRIVAVGYIPVPAAIGFTRGTAIARWLPDGRPDPNFGTDGLLIVDPPVDLALKASKLALRPDGGYLVAGFGTPVGPDQELVILSVQENGTLDTGFAGQGWVTADAAEDAPAIFIDESLYGLEILPDGTIAVATWRCNCVALFDSPDWFDNDGDGIGDKADPDDDNDGIADVNDLFPFGAFDDAGMGHWAFSFVERLANSRITGGCGENIYCPDAPVTRAQMAVFLERGIRGSSFVPPAASGTVFSDVGASDFSANFIEQLYSDGITTGCGNNNYCPTAEVSRAQMAVFLLRAKYGSGYSPPPATGIFNDLDLSYWAVHWIEQLAAEGITGGCGGGNFCPDQSVTRAQMAVFLVRTFGL